MDLAVFDSRRTKIFDMPIATENPLKRAQLQRVRESQGRHKLGVGQNNTMAANSNLGFSRKLKKIQRHKFSLDAP